MRLRGKLLLLSLGLLVLPWAGWQYLRLVGEVLREGEERALLASAEALARALARQPALLPSAGPALPVQPLRSRPRLDGDERLWLDGLAGERAFGSARAGGDAVRVLLGSHAERLYLRIDVADDTPQRGDAHWSIADRFDHLWLALHGRQGLVELRLANAQAGPLQAAPAGGGQSPLQLEGRWHERAGGYRVELALPQGYGLRALAIRMHDADETGPPRVADSSDGNDGRPWPVVEPSGALASTLAQLVPPGSRVRVHDPAGWPLAQAGEPGALRIDGAVPLWRRWLYQRLLFDAAAPLPPGHAALGRADDDLQRQVAQGAAATAWWRDGDSQRPVLAAAVPVRINDAVRAGLRLERESDALLRLTDRAFSGVFAVTALAVLVVVVALLLFAARLGGRIRALRDGVEGALGEDGRIAVLPAARAGDEIGDLSRSFARLLAQLRDYTGYLRGLAGTLSHELSTPIAIVRGSLENLEADPGGAQARVYLERARSGVERLAGLVRALGEATRIEQAVAGADIERFDLRALVADCAEGYRPLLAPRRLEVALPPAPLPFTGAPDLIAQALDKLVDNARGFCPPDGWIRIALDGGARDAVIRVANSGPRLPAAMRERLFDSLVSVREQRSGGVHLGLGLHIVRLVAGLHQGQAGARDLDDGSGVEFELRLATPAARA